MSDSVLDQSDRVTQSVSGLQDSGSPSLFKIEAPDQAIQRYKDGHPYAASAPALHTPTSDQRKTQDQWREVSDVHTDRSSPDFVIEHPRVIAEVLGYSWSDSYYSQTSQQQRDRWMAHQTFGRVVMSEGGPSRGTTVASTPMYGRGLPDSPSAIGPQRGQPVEYTERYYPENVWAYRPAAVAQQAPPPRSPVQSSTTTAVSASEVMVSIAAPAGRRRGYVTTTAAQSSAVPIAGRRHSLSLEMQPLQDTVRLEASVSKPLFPASAAGPEESTLASQDILPDALRGNQTEKNVEPQISVSARPHGMDRTSGPPVSSARFSMGQSTDVAARQIAATADDSLFIKERNTKLSMQPTTLAARTLSNLHRDNLRHHAAITEDTPNHDGTPSFPPSARRPLARSSRTSAPGTATGTPVPEGSNEKSTNVLVSSESPVLPAKGSMRRLSASSNRMSGHAAQEANANRMSRGLHTHEMRLDEEKGSAPASARTMVRSAQGRPLRAVYIDEDE